MEEPVTPGLSTVGTTTEPLSQGDGVRLLAERLRVVMGIVEALDLCETENDLARAAVELARERLGLERCALFLREGDGFVGTFGTDGEGNTCIESHVVPMFGQDIKDFAKEIRGGSRTWSKAIRPWIYFKGTERHVVGSGEVALSVLRTASGAIGLFFNDNTLSKSPIDDEKQEAVAIYASLLASVIERHRGSRERDNARELFERIFNAVPSSIVIYKSSDTILMANAMARRLYSLGEKTSLEGMHVSALGFEAKETEAIIEQNRRLLTEPGKPVEIDEVRYHVLGRRKVFKRLKFPITLPGSRDRALLSISDDVTELRESADRQSLISRGLRKVVTVSDELGQIRDRKLFFRRAIEFCRKDLGLERCSIYILEDGFHQGTWGTDSRGNIIDESAFRIPATPEVRNQWVGKVEESGRGFHLHEGDLSENPDGMMRVVGRGTVAITLIRSHSEICGVFYNDNLLTGSPIDLATQEVITVFCSILGNLMERLRLEEQRERSAMQYQNLFEQTPTANFICTIDGRIRTCNRPFAQILGFENPNQVIDQSVGEFLPRRESVRLLRALQEHGSLSGEVFEARTVGGEQCIVSAHVSSITGESHGVIGYQGFLVDTTEQVRGERALEELARATALPGGEGFFPALLEGLSRATSVPHIVLCESIPDRPEWLRVIASRKISAKPGAEFPCHDIPGELVMNRGEFHQTLGLHHSFPLCGIAQELHAEGFYGLTLTDSGGTVLGALGLFSTRSLLLSPRMESIIRIFTTRAAAELERMRGERALRDSEMRFLHAQKLEALGRFAGSIAHDFNNLLTTILTLSDMAADTLPQNHPVRDDIMQINRISLKAGNLTRQLLNFGRAQSRGAGVIRIDRTMVDLNTMLKRMLGESIHFEMQVSPESGAIVIDRSQFEQVIVNLVVNARDAMPNGGLIRFSASAVELREGDPRLLQGLPPTIYTQLQISDTGEGIEPENLTRVFEPFFSTKSDMKGTGLGLFTVYTIVTQNGGMITVESAPGSGSTFTILLPRSEFTPSEEPPEEDGKIDSSVSRHETLLLAEDDETVRHSVVGILRRMNYNVLEAPGGGEALLMCERHPGPIHLLLTDVRMPHMNGFELAQRVRRLRPGIRVVFMSGYIDDTEGRHRPPDAQVLAKPFSSKVLNAWIRRALDDETPIIAEAPPT